MDSRTVFRPGPKAEEQCRPYASLFLSTTPCSTKCSQSELQQLEIENGGMEAFLPKTGLARGTYYTILRGIGNPTLRTVERIASSLHMSVLELLGFRGDDARRALKRSGVDYDELVSAIGKKNRADRALARQTRSRKLPS